MLGVNRVEIKEEPKKEFVKNFISPGIRKIAISDFKAFKTQNSILIAALCEEVGEGGRKFEGISGASEAKGMYGEIKIEWVSHVDEDKKKAAFVRLSKDLTAIAEVTGSLDVYSKIDVAYSDDTEQYVKTFLKEVLKAVKGKEFWAIVNGEQNGKYDRLSFNRNGAKDENGKWQMYPASVYSTDIVKEVAEIPNENYTGCYTMTATRIDANGVELNNVTFAKNPRGDSDWNYKWEEASSEENRFDTPSTGGVEINDLPETGDDLPF